MKKDKRIPSEVVGKALSWRTHFNVPGEVATFIDDITEDSRQVDATREFCRTHQVSFEDISALLNYLVALAYWMYDAAKQRGAPYKREGELNQHFIESGQYELVYRGLIEVLGEDEGEKAAEALRNRALIILNDKLCNDSTN